MRKACRRGVGFLPCLILLGLICFGGRYQPDRVVLKTAVYFFALVFFLVLPAHLKVFLFSMTLPLLILEAGLRLDDAYAHYRYESESGEEVLWAYDPVLGWKMRPGQEGYYSSIKNRFRNKIRINSKGLRDEEYPYEKPAGVQRILLLGDSMAVGLEVAKEDLIDTQLENLLNRSGRYEVINLSARGYSTDQLFLLLREEGLKYQPDIVIYLFVGNDPSGNISAHRPKRAYGKSYFVLEKEALVLKGTPVPERFEPYDEWVMSDRKIQDFYNQAMKKMDAEDAKAVENRSLVNEIKHDFSIHLHAYRWIVQHVRENYDLSKVLSRLGLMTLSKSGNEEIPADKPAAVLEYEWQITKALIQEMAKISESRGAVFLVYEVTALGSPDNRETDLEKICKEISVPYIDSFQTFYQESKGRGRLHFPYDGHWNAGGHALAAKIIRDYLVEYVFSTKPPSEKVSLIM